MSQFLYASRQHGGLGLSSLEDQLDITRVTRVVRCPSSPDRKVQDVAWDQLSAVVRKRLGRDSIADEDIQTFVNTRLESREAAKGDVKSIWSTVRKSLSNLKCEILLCGTEVKLAFDNLTAQSDLKAAVRKVLSEAKFLEASQWSPRGERSRAQFPPCVKAPHQ